MEIHSKLLFNWMLKTRSAGQHRSWYRPDINPMEASIHVKSATEDVRKPSQEERAIEREWKFSIQQRINKWLCVRKQKTKQTNNNNTNKLGKFTIVGESIRKKKFLLCSWNLCLLFPEGLVWAWQDLMCLDRLKYETWCQNKATNKRRHLRFYELVISTNTRKELGYRAWIRI